MKNMKRLTACGAAAAVMLTAAPVCEAEEETVDRNNIIIDGTTANLKENMRYRGAGMVSGNNSSRLLLDYKAEDPEAYVRQGGHRYNSPEAGNGLRCKLIIGNRALGNAQR